MNRDELISRLLAFDEEVYLTYSPRERIKVVIVGGGALILMRTISRMTMDIDVLMASHKIQDLMAEYDINTNVQSYMNNFPFNFEDRLVPVDIESKAIDFYTASLEDIIVAKLYSARPTDIEDITSPDVLSKADWDLLHHLATDEGEAKANAMNERQYHEFLDTYNDYERRYRR